MTIFSVVTGTVAVVVAAVVFGFVTTVVANQSDDELVFANTFYFAIIIAILAKVIATKTVITEGKKHNKTKQNALATWFQCIR